MIKEAFLVVDVMRVIMKTKKFVKNVFYPVLSVIQQLFVQIVIKIIQVIIFLEINANSVNIHA